MLGLLSVLGAFAVAATPGLDWVPASLLHGQASRPADGGGTITGRIIPPQPAELDLLFENTVTTEAVCLRVAPGETSYSVTVPSGTYHAYTWLPDLSGMGAFTTCVSDQACQERSLAPIAVAPGEVRSGADVADWYVPETAPFVLRGRLIDGTGTEPVEDAALAIWDRRIVAIGPASELVPPGDVELLDFPGTTILPGFINAHVHNAYANLYAATWAFEGVTTVRDLGAPVHSPWDTLREALEPYPRHTRILAAGPLVTCPGGYPIVPNGFPSLAISSADQARTEIDRLIDRGADVIKIALESSAGPVLAPHLVAAIVETAHARGIPVTVHATRLDDLRRALDAGVDDIAHMVRDSVPDDVIRRMVETGVGWVPTLAVTEGAGRTLQNLRRFVEAGGTVALSNDAGYLPGVTIGMPLLEIEWMQRAGMTPMEILVAATRDAAIVCARENLLGTLELGKLADVLVVEGDPLQDLRALEQVRLVVHDGVIIRQE